MPVLNLVQAVNDALRVQLKADPRAVILGEDIGKFGGVFRATVGLYDEFGPERVIDTPLAEGGIIGTALGMAAYGMRPIPEIQFADFIFPAFDQIVSEVAKLRYRSGGMYSCPMVIRSPYGGGVKGGHYHSQSPEALFIHTAGLKVVVPSTPYDAKGLLLSALRQGRPGALLRAQALLPSRQRRGPRGRLHRAARRGQGGARRQADHAHRLGSLAARLGRGSGEGDRRRASTSSSSTCAPSGRSTSTRWCGAPRRPAAWWSSTRRRAPAAWAPRSSR